jgi:nucleoside-diphosphate-sugar epimerase
MFGYRWFRFCRWPFDRVIAPRRLAGPCDRAELGGTAACQITRGRSRACRPEDETALRHALQDCTTVFHAAALFKLWGSEDEFNRANVEGTRRLLAVARSVGVRSFVQIGASAVVMGEPVPMRGVAEDAPLRIRSWAPYSSSKAKSECLVREANVPGSFHTAVIRPPLIWGQGMPMLDQMVRSIETKQFRWLAGVNYFFR